VRAAELVPGDTVATRAGTATVVRVAPHDAPEVVYNLRVERTARYLVGACGAVVHNSPCSEAAEGGLRRPYIRKATRAEVEAAAPRDSLGRAIDPNTRLPIEGKPDLGHKPGHEFWREKQQAEIEGLSQREFNDRMNDSGKYQLENPSSNRSRRYEKRP
jgi:hypothetical protein